MERLRTLYQQVDQVRCGQRLCGADDDLLEQGKRRTLTCTRGDAIGLQQDKTSSYQVSNWRQGHAGRPTSQTSPTFIQAGREIPWTLRNPKLGRPFGISPETSQVLDHLSCLQRSPPPPPCRTEIPRSRYL